MDSSTRSLLLNTLFPAGRRDVIPVKRNGCVCFIPIPNPKQDIRNRCIINCILAKEEEGEFIDGNTWRDCSICCDICVNFNGENCETACGAPVEDDLLERINRAIIGSTTAHPSSTNIGGPIVYQTQFSLANSFVQEIYCEFGSMLGQGDTITLTLAHRRSEEQDLELAERFDILTIARDFTNNTLFVVNPACVGQLAARSAAVLGPGGPFVSQLFVTYDTAAGVSQVIGEGPINQFMSASNILPIPVEAEIFCNGNISDVTSQNVPIPSC